MSAPHSSLGPERPAAQRTNSASASTGAFGSHQQRPPAMMQLSPASIDPGASKLFYHPHDMGGTRPVPYPHPQQHHHQLQSQISLSAEDLAVELNAAPAPKYKAAKRTPAPHAIPSTAPLPSSSIHPAFAAVNVMDAHAMHRYREGVPAPVISTSSARPPAAAAGSQHTTAHRHPQEDPAAAAAAQLHGVQPSRSGRTHHHRVRKQVECATPSGFRDVSTLEHAGARSSMDSAHRSGVGHPFRDDDDSHGLSRFRSSSSAAKISGAHNSGKRRQTAPVVRNLHLGGVDPVGLANLSLAKLQADQQTAHRNQGHFFEEAPLDDLLMPARPFNAAEVRDEVKRKRKSSKSRPSMEEPEVNGSQVISPAEMPEATSSRRKEDRGEKSRRRDTAGDATAALVESKKKPDYDKEAVQEFMKRKVAEGRKASKEQKENTERAARVVSERLTTLDEFRKKQRSSKRREDGTDALDSERHTERSATGAHQSAMSDRRHRDGVQNGIRDAVEDHFDAAIRETFGTDHKPSRQADHNSDRLADMASDRLSSKPDSTYARESRTKNLIEPVDLKALRSNPTPAHSTPSTTPHRRRPSADKLGDLTDAFQNLRPPASHVPLVNPPRPPPRLPTPPAMTGPTSARLMSILQAAEALNMRLQQHQQPQLPPYRDMDDDGFSDVSSTSSLHRGRRRPDEPHPSLLVGGSPRRLMSPSPRRSSVASFDGEIGVGSLREYERRRLERQNSSGGKSRDGRDKKKRPAEARTDSRGSEGRGLEYQAALKIQRCFRNWVRARGGLDGDKVPLALGQGSMSSRRRRIDSGSIGSIALGRRVDDRMSVDDFDNDDSVDNQVPSPPTMTRGGRKADKYNVINIFERRFPLDVELERVVPKEKHSSRKRPSLDEGEQHLRRKSSSSKHGDRRSSEESLSTSRRADSVNSVGERKSSSRRESPQPSGMAVEHVSQPTKTFVPINPVEHRESASSNRSSIVEVPNAADRVSPERVSPVTKTPFTPATPKYINAATSPRIFGSGKGASAPEELRGTDSTSSYGKATDSQYESKAAVDHREDLLRSRTTSASLSTSSDFGLTTSASVSSLRDRWERISERERTTGAHREFDRNGRLSPGSLARKFGNEMNYLESVTEAINQVDELKRHHEISLVSYEKTTYADLLREKQLQHDRDLEHAKAVGKRKELEDLRIKNLQSEEKPREVISTAGPSRGPKKGTAPPATAYEEEQFDDLSSFHKDRITDDIVASTHSKAAKLALDPISESDVIESLERSPVERSNAARDLRTPSAVSSFIKDAESAIPISGLNLGNGSESASVAGRDKSRERVESISERYTPPRKPVVRGSKISKVVQALESRKSFAEVVEEDDQATSSGAVSISENISEAFSHATGKASVAIDLPSRVSERSAVSDFGPIPETSVIESLLEEPYSEFPTAPASEAEASLSEVAPARQASTSRTRKRADVVPRVPEVILSESSSSSSEEEDEFEDDVSSGISSVVKKLKKVPPVDFSKLERKEKRLEVTRSIAEGLLIKRKEKIEWERRLKEETLAIVRLIDEAADMGDSKAVVRDRTRSRSREDKRLMLDGIDEHPVVTSPSAKDSVEDHADDAPQFDLETPRIEFPASSPTSEKEIISEALQVNSNIDAYENASILESVVRESIAAESGTPAIVSSFEDPNTEDPSSVQMEEDFAPESKPLDDDISSFHVEMPSGKSSIHDALDERDYVDESFADEALSVPKIELSEAAEAAEKYSIRSSSSKNSLPDDLEDEISAEQLEMERRIAELQKELEEKKAKAQTLMARKQAKYLAQRAEMRERELALRKELESVNTIIVKTEKELREEEAAKAIALSKPETPLAKSKSRKAQSTTSVAAALHSPQIIIEEVAKVLVDSKDVERAEELTVPLSVKSHDTVEEDIHTVEASLHMSAKREDLVSQPAGYEDDFESSAGGFSSTDRSHARSEAESEQVLLSERAQIPRGVQDEAASLRDGISGSVGDDSIEEFIEEIDDGSQNSEAAKEHLSSRKESGGRLSDSKPQGQEASLKDERSDTSLKVDEPTEASQKSVGQFSVAITAGPAKEGGAHSTDVSENAYASDFEETSERALEQMQQRPVGQRTPSPTQENEEIEEDFPEYEEEVSGGSGKVSVQASEPSVREPQVALAEAEGVSLRDDLSEASEHVADGEDAIGVNVQANQQLSTNKPKHLSPDDPEGSFPIYEDVKDEVPPESMSELTPTSPHLKASDSLTPPPEVDFEGLADEISAALFTDAFEDALNAVAEFSKNRNDCQEKAEVFVPTIILPGSPISDPDVIEVADLVEEKLEVEDEAAKTGESGERDLNDRVDAVTSSIFADLLNETLQMVKAKETHERKQADLRATVKVEPIKREEIAAAQVEPECFVKGEPLLTESYDDVSIPQPLSTVSCRSSLTSLASRTTSTSITSSSFAIEFVTALLGSLVDMPDGYISPPTLPAEVLNEACDGLPAHIKFRYQLLYEVVGEAMDELFALHRSGGAFGRGRRASRGLKCLGLQPKPLQAEEVKEGVLKAVKGWAEYSEIHGENLDALLIQEVKEEERRWQDIGLEETVVMESCFQSIWQEVLDDTSKVVEDALLKKDRVPLLTH